VDSNIKCSPAVQLLDSKTEKGIFQRTIDSFIFIFYYELIPGWHSNVRWHN